jgi:hypothetical protein
VKDPAGRATRQQEDLPRLDLVRPLGIGVNRPGESILPLRTDGLRPSLHQDNVGLQGDVRVPPGPQAIPFLGIGQLVDVGERALACNGGLLLLAASSERQKAARSSAELRGGMRATMVPS